ncbi:aldo/keto reductase [Alteromonas aestuariivivens]|uniref:Aldo/keto reductase n=1 Tax=Alteromonas aestuariivivens TaxID=1938339 RepID=A0A3D8M7K1_9ALTE|nr:aldo/keto reductase [Alteromonas aestuariivivens]RDV25640.1 aldo/keto reductase [Alteromonas aestuariivivens]
MLQNFYPNASQLIYGCMGLGGDWDHSPITREHYLQARTAVETALEEGITVFDHADIYTMGKAETVFGQVLKDTPSLRNDMIIQSKCAIRFEDELGPKRYEISADWIRQSVEQSLTRLGLDHLEILLLHRPDPLMELAEVAECLTQLIQEGKIAHVGVSNMHWHQIQYLQSALDKPIVANQLEMSLAFRDWMEDGITTGSTANRNSGFAPGTLEYCMTHNVQLQAWGSLAQGRFTGGTTSGTTDEATRQAVAELAALYQVTPEAIVLGWLTRHPANIQPIIGSTKPERIRACTGVSELRLSREHWYHLLETVWGREVP